MDGENNGSKPYEQMDDLRGKKPPIFWVDTHMKFAWFRHPSNTYP